MCIMMEYFGYVEQNNNSFLLNQQGITWNKFFSVWSEKLYVGMLISTILTVGF